MIKVAIIGYGTMGRVHHESYKKLPDAEVVAICDISVDFSNIEKNAPVGNISTEKADQPQNNPVKYFDHVDKLLSYGEFDAVDICLPTFLHAEMAINMLEAGFPVITEKPMACDLESANRMIETSRSTGRILSVAQCLRFWPAYREIKRIIDSAEYGKVTYATFARYGGIPKWSWENWMQSEERSGGALLDLHIHDTDMIQFLFGTPASVMSLGIDQEQVGIRHVDTLYRYDDKVVHGSGGWSASSSFGFSMMGKVALERGFLVLDFKNSDPLTIYPEDGEPITPVFPSEDGYYFELEDFITGIARGSLSGTVTPESAAESVRICLAETESVRSKREVDLSAV